MTKKIPVLSYTVQMTIFVSDKRPEILPLLEAVAEANEKYQPVQDYLGETLFPGLPPRFVVNVIEELRLLGLIDQGKLTPMGEETRLKKEVMVPQTGIYEVQVISDPLIPQVFIGYDPLEADLREELSSTKQNGQIDILPDYILGKQGSRFRTIARDSRTIAIKEIKEKGSLIAGKKRVMEIELTFDGDWQLKVNYDNFTTTVDIPEFFKGENVIDQLLYCLSPRADLNYWRVPQDPRSLKDMEITRFLKTFRLKDVEITGGGTFQQVTMEEVEIVPDNQESTEEWAQRLFLLHLSVYVPEKHYGEMWKEMISSHNGFNGFYLLPPHLEELWSRIPFGSQKYWFLRAPADLKLE
ncbi:MAG: hypothetical protein ACFFD4_32875 [Candidatus Odinarchaeota archaeon]